MDGAADLAIIGASLETMSGNASGADALAVRDGRIVAVGRSADLRPLLGPRTELVELHGETVIPGFQDAHVHPIHGGLLHDECDLYPLTDASAYVAAIAAYGAAHPDRAWITGSGWAMPAFAGGNPTRAVLDAVVADRPVFLWSRDGHSAWVNSRALEVVGIGSGTADPPDGRIERDEDGAPCGTLHEGAADLVDQHVPQPTTAEMASALIEAQRYLHSLGVTAWQDARATSAELTAYRDAAANGRLTARVVASQLWDTARGLEQIGEMVAQRLASASDRLQAGTVKFFVDGIIENGTALMTAPYLDAGGEPTANHGMPMLEPKLLRQAVVALDELGFQCHFHAIGDGAVRLALDAIEGARDRNGRTDGRHHIAHLEVINPVDIPRFAALGATATIQPIWATLDAQMIDLRIPVLGPERTGWQYSFRSLQRAGAHLAGGSDWTVSTPDPLLEVEAAVTRVDADDRGAEPFLPHERLDLDAALRAYTIGSAYVNHLDASTGSLEVGKLADLVVLDRNLHSEDGRPIGEARVSHTFVDGREVYRR
ncbi:MAG: amidohydrolase [Chloroflexota bacterium]